MNIEPLGDRIVVRPDTAAEKSPGGILIPDTAKEKPRRGKVLAIGGGKLDSDGKLIQMLVKEGDTVLFGPYAGHEVKLGGEDLLILSESDVFGKVV